MKLQAAIDGKRSGQKVSVPVSVEDGEVHFTVPTAKPREHQCEFSVAKADLLAAVQALDGQGSPGRAVRDQPQA